ncbi:MAG: hypothetical protein ACTSPY_10845 [Candidatus Helarchaeota archaeon]
MQGIDNLVFLLFFIMYILTFIAIFIEIYLVYYLGKRYLRRKTIVLKYLFLAFVFFLILTILTNFIINFPLIRIDLIIGEYAYITSIIIAYKGIYILGVIIVCLYNSFLFILFLSKPRYGLISLIYMIGGIFIGLLIWNPLEFEGTPLQPKPPLSYFPSNLLFTGIWIFNLILETTWLVIIWSRKYKPENPVKRKGFDYIWKGSILGLIAIFASFLMRLIPFIEPIIAEILYSIIYWIFSIVSNLYYAIGLVMPEWVKKRVIGMSWIESQGKKLS